MPVLTGARAGRALVETGTSPGSHSNACCANEVQRVKEFLSDRLATEAAICLKFVESPLWPKTERPLAARGVWMAHA